MPDSSRLASFLQGEAVIFVTLGAAVLVLAAFMLRVFEGLLQK